MSRVSVIVLAVVICMGCTAAFAEAIPSTEGWMLTPIIDGNNVSLGLDLGDVSAFAGYQGTLTKTWGDPTLSDPSKYISLGDSGAKLRSFTVSFTGDPILVYHANVQAGNTVTNFTLPVASNVMPVLPNLYPAKARATAGITLTDFVDGDSADGVIAMGGYTGGTFYRASYNVGTDPKDFAYLIAGPKTVDPYISQDFSDNSGVWQTLPDVVKDMETSFKFSLTPHDYASMTSSFFVEPVPEPSSVLALMTGLAGVAGFLRRRRS